MKWFITGIDMENKNVQRILLCSQLEDYYPGEQLDFLLSVLSQIRDRCPKDSRAREIVESILASNEPIGEGKRILDGVEKVLRRGKIMDKRAVSSFETLGFSFVRGKKHAKLRFHGKYLYVLSCSPSDTCHGLNNVLSEISKCIAVKQKI